MAWITPKTNWTKDDYYNFGDLNRVKNNVNEIMNLINTITTMSELVINTTRDITSFEFYDSLDRVEGNIQALANACYQPIGWITPVTNWVSGLMGFDYIAANRMESNLLGLYTMLNKIIAYMKYCGQFYAGQDVTYL